MDIKLNCAFCGSEFVGHSHNAKYCSKKCRDKAENKRNLVLREKKCNKCGEKYMGTYSQRYCINCQRQIQKDVWTNMPEEQKAKRYLQNKIARSIQLDKYKSQTEEEKAARAKLHGDIFKRRRESLSEEERKNQCKKAEKGLKSNIGKRIKEKGYAWGFQKPGVVEKAIKAYKENAKKREEETGYAWPCQLPQVRESTNIISKGNYKWRAILEEKGYSVDMEFPLGYYSYDLKINNTLIEINPLPYHNSTWAPKGAKPKPKMYHYDKAKYAINKGYNIIFIWERTDINDVLFILDNNLQIKLGDIKLHRYNGKTKSHIIDEGFNRDDMIQKGYAEIYDGGEFYS